MIEVENWCNAQNFEAKVAIDSTRLRNVSPLAMTPAQRDIVAHIAMLPEEERIELVRYLSAQLLVEKYRGEYVRRGGMTRRQGVRLASSSPAYSLFAFLVWWKGGSPSAFLPS